MARWWPPRCDDGDDAPVVEGNRNGYAAVLWIFILSDPELGASIISTPLLENQPLLTSLTDTGCSRLLADSPHFDETLNTGTAAESEIH